MSTERKRAGGREAQSMGSFFEILFHQRCLWAGFEVTRIPDGCKQIGPGRIVRVTSPFDWIISKDAFIGLIDTKSTKGKSFAHSAIDRNQISEMIKHKNLTSGYVIWFRELDRCVFIKSSDLHQRMFETGSIKLGDRDLIDLGPKLDIKEIL